MSDDLRKALGNAEKWQIDAFHARQKWLATSRPSQVAPQGTDWDIWAFVGGRGTGKTRSLAEEIAHRALWYPAGLGSPFRGAYVAPTASDLLEVCFEGESGLLSVIPESCIDKFNRSHPPKIYLKNGSQITGFAAEAPERMRGNQFNFAACEEMAFWQQARYAWDMLQFCMRLGKFPQTAIATTPKKDAPGYPLLREIRDFSKGIRPSDMAPTSPIPRVVLTQGTTLDNAKNLPDAFLRSILRYDGTERGREEIHAEFLDDTGEAVMKRAWWRPWLERKLPRPEAIVISLDTAFKPGKKNDSTACIVAGLFWVPFKISEPHPTIKDKKIDRIQHGWILGIIRCWKAKLTYPDLKKMVRLEFDHWAKKYDYEPARDGDNGPVKILIEDAASGQALYQEFHAAGLPVVLSPVSNVKGRKLFYANLVSDLLKDGLVYALGKFESDIGRRSDKSFEADAEELIRECENFTGNEEEGKPDDYVDALTQLLQYARNERYLIKTGDRLGPSVRKPALEEEEEDRGASSSHTASPYG